MISVMTYNRHFVTILYVAHIIIIIIIIVIIIVIILC